MVSKEFNELLESIHKWVEKHKGNVMFTGSFMAFKGKDFDIVDDRIFAFGDKSMLRDCLKDLDTLICEEKEEFVNW